jgi:hypothetical protein
MSPEQARAKELDARSDLFSFGAVLYEMTTGQLPFRGESPAVIFKTILDAAPTPAMRLNPDVPPKLEEIINKALEKDPNLRYQHAADMRTDLQWLKRDSESGRNVAAEAPAALVAKLWKITIPVLLVALLVAGGLYYRSHQQDKFGILPTNPSQQFCNEGRACGQSAREFFAGAKESGLAFALVGPLPHPQLQLLMLRAGFQRLVRLLGRGRSGKTGDRYQPDECFHGMVGERQRYHMGRNLNGERSAV